MKFREVLIMAGIFLFLAAGVALAFWQPWLVSWFGQLPGDIAMHTSGSTLLFPFTSFALLVAGVWILIFLARVIRKLFRSR